MRIGIISDIHDNIPNLLKAFKVLLTSKVIKVYFLGDLVSPFTLKFFQSLKIPVKAVFGNNEGDKLGIQRRIKKYKLAFEYEGKQGLIHKDKIDGLSIICFHGHIPEITDSLLNDEKFNLVMTGHTHNPHLKKLKNIIWINPGSVSGFSETIFNKPSLALFETVSQKAEIIKL